MRLNRFFIDERLVVGDLRLTDDELLNQWKNVLKLKVDDQVVLINEGFGEALARIALLTKKEAVVKIEKITEVLITNENLVTLHCAILKKDNFELVCQKATEVGVDTIVPVLTDRTVKLALNQDRLEKIVREASEQSGRTTIPKIGKAISLKDLLWAKPAGRKIILDMSGSKPTPADTKGINILIGPEGGFTDKEIMEAKNSGWEPVSLGENVYRAETAAIIGSYLGVVKLI
jgi:16S rRNA (uracil1498-N3)-methyltransferase